MIVLIGFMGAGKTTVGRLLAARLGLPFADTDVIIEQRAGRPIREIFATEGETGFRALEHQVTARLLAGSETVLALGGGAVAASGHPACPARARRRLPRSRLCGVDGPGRPGRVPADAA